MFPFLFLVMGMMSGCEKDIPHDYYKGEIISLNRDGCHDLIKIQQSIENGLAVGNNINFNASSHNKQLKVGDIVYFKIINYEKWEGFVLGVCFAPTYSAIIEFYND